MLLEYEKILDVLFGKLEENFIQDIFQDLLLGKIVYFSQMKLKCCYEFQFGLNLWKLNILHC